MKNQWKENRANVQKEACKLYHKFVGYILIDIGGHGHIHVIAVIREIAEQIHVQCFKVKKIL